MDIFRRDIVERVARRRISQKGDAVATMEPVDRGREARRLAGEAGQHEAAAAAADHLGEVGAGVAGRSKIMSTPCGSKPSIQREKRDALLKIGVRSIQRTKATGKPIARACASAARQFASALLVSSSASTRGLAMYSCCRSTRTRVWMTDGFT